MLGIAFVDTCLALQAPPADESVPTFGTTVVISSGLRGEVYFLRDNSWALPDFAKLKPVGTIYTKSLNVQVRDFMEGFPGISRRFEWFAIDYRGRFWIDKPGKYRFALLCDDGAKLYIDDKVVINADGMHAPETSVGSVELAGGIHRIRVSYFQGPRFQVALVLSVAPPGGRFRIFNTDDFKPPTDPAEWKYGTPEDLLADADPRTSKPAEEDATAALLAALNAQPPPQAFDFQIAAYRFRNQGGVWQGVLLVQVPVASMTATHDPRRKLEKLHMALLALVKGSEGQVADRFQLDVPYEVPAAKFQEVQGTAARYGHLLHLAPGRYRIEVGAMDREANRASVRALEAEYPQPEPGISISSLLLVERVEPVGAASDPDDPLSFGDKRVVPLMSAALDVKEKPHAYFVVYPDAASTEKPRILVEFLVGGQVLARQTAELPAPDASGAIPMLVSAAVQPGDNELRITAMQGVSRMTESVRYTGTSK
jgi:hypothetical protein